MDKAAESVQTGPAASMRIAETTLFCLDEEKRPIKGYVEFVYTKDRRRIDSHVQRIDADGFAAFPSIGGLAPTVAHVKPIDGNWNALVKNPTSEMVCECRSIERPQATTWWKRVMGRRGTNPSSAKGMRIGIIDLGFQPDGPLEHVVFRDVENAEIDFPCYPQISHGSRIAKIIGERGGSEEREGAAAGAEIFFVDISEETDAQTIDGELLGAAIELLVDEHRVDLINISAGFFVEAGQGDYAAVLQKSVRYARNRGALVIAATGNDAQRPPAVPARLDEVVGVGAIGLGGLAPPGSHMRTYELLAAEAEGALGRLADGTCVFHHIDTSFGAGLDVVAPGIGLTLCYGESTIIEYAGTSYSCPLVVGVLACALGRDETYQGLKGPVRSQHALECLHGLSQSLGMDVLRQGIGLPILPPVC